MSCLDDFYDFYDFYAFYDFNGFTDLPFTVYRLLEISALSQEIGCWFDVLAIGDQKNRVPFL